MAQQDEKKWRELCNQAIAENDPNKLLHACLAVNRIMEQAGKAHTARPAFGLKSLLKGIMERVDVYHGAADRPETRRLNPGTRCQLNNLRIGNVRQIGAVVAEVTKQKTLEQSLDKLTNRLLEIRDDEQRRIARELHDSLGQYHIGLKLNLDTLHRKELASDQRDQILADCTQLLDRCISETRTISYLLHPPLLDEAGFASAARWYVDGFAQRSGIKVNLYLAPASARLPQRVEMALFRVLQESLTNVHRHANASAVDIHLERNIEAVAMEVKDYGRGIPPEQLQRLQEPGSIGTVGLAGMRERVHQLAGRLDIRSDHGGTVVSVTIPVACSETKSIMPQPIRKSARALGRGLD